MGHWILTSGSLYVVIFVTIIRGIIDNIANLF